jgi:hypothetical protein
VVTHQVGKAREEQHCGLKKNRRRRSRRQTDQVNYSTPLQE